MRVGQSDDRICIHIWILWSSDHDPWLTKALQQINAYGLIFLLPEKSLHNIDMITHLMIGILC